MADRLFAPHYAQPVARPAGPDGANLYETPGQSAEVLGELGPHESFALLDVTGDWAWGYRSSDHLVGYVQASKLTASEG